MKVKNQFLVIAILTIFLGILLCSCKTENSEVPEDRYSVFQKGFASSMGNKIVESPDGFYLFYGNFLTFLDKNFENPVTVCDKPECRHLEEAEEHVVECNAFYGNPRDIKYYNGKLYIAADAMDGANQAIYQVDLDGNGRNKIYTAETQGEFCFLIYKGDIIAYEQQYNETQVSAEIIRFPINDPKQAETLFSGKETGSRMDIETFAQRYYMQQILLSANKRFYEMSAGQYELQMLDADKAGEGANKGLDLMVYSFVTGKKREITTLSGGESFMAALSLALGMSDQIQSNSASVNLDIMFIDEGFGTLDERSRNQAVKVLKNMAGGSKLIGIISHVSELKNEIDNQLIVTKDDTGSHIKWQIS